ncbi:hypothetical protein BCY91_15285 [Pelobium manganitolerans]|uniref:DUF4142 domain-containing protein n=1 Tax=Pelobium manganitolerans TaxID=1842495 RepID=A0A419S9J4_9SPHI|nr:DUF4142 domain-containing protein [Pelobium manganitolerans]RKD18693.1 hypothetical protein BCY91_15285 [Pelobium manganitolerans]
MKKLILMTAIGLGALSFQACTNQQANSDAKDSLDSLNEQPMVETTDDGSEFLTEAASGGMMEVELGKLAQEKSANQQVKDFGNMMVTEHSKANDELKQLAMSKNVSLPDAPLPKHQDEIDKLKEKSGVDFDKAYIDLMVSDHKNDIDDFQDIVDNGKDQGITTFATKTLPVLKKHLEAAQSIKDQLK